MTTVRTEATRDSLRRLGESLRHAAVQALHASQVAAIESAKSTTRFKDHTGETRASIHMQSNPGLHGFVVAGGAARFLEYGTSPHTIVAHGKALRFVVNGTVLYRRWVRHPGTKERPFMREARDLAQRTAEYGAEHYAAEAIARAR